MELFRYKGIVNADREELAEALSLFAQKTPLGIGDCILSVKAGKSKSILFTFNEALMSHSKRLT